MHLRGDAGSNVGAPSPRGAEQLLTQAVFPRLQVLAPVAPSQPPAPATTRRQPRARSTQPWCSVLRRPRDTPGAISSLAQRPHDRAPGQHSRRPAAFHAQAHSLELRSGSALRPPGALPGQPVVSAVSWWAAAIACHPGRQRARCKHMACACATPCTVTWPQAALRVGRRRGAEYFH